MPRISEPLCNPSPLVRVIAWARSKLLYPTHEQVSLIQSFSMAYHEMRLIISRVLFLFNLELCPESEGWNDQSTYIIWEKRPLMVKLSLASTS